MASENLSIESRLTFHDGYSIPCFGLGVYQAKTGRETEESVYNALKAGYRHIDTAEFYENEQDVGKALIRWRCDTLDSS